MLADLLNPQVVITLDKRFDHTMLALHHGQHGAEITHLMVILYLHLPCPSMGGADLDDCRERVPIHQRTMAAGEVLWHDRKVVPKALVVTVQLTLHRWTLAHHQNRF
jgi:hypothetical protein